MYLPKKEKGRKIRNALSGKKRQPFTEQWKKRISEAAVSGWEKRRKNPDNFKPRKPMSEETKKKLSEINKGKKLSEETKQKIKMAQQLRWSRVKTSY
jgi:hypothetical protein